MNSRDILKKIENKELTAEQGFYEFNRRLHGDDRIYYHGTWERGGDPGPDDHRDGADHPHPTRLILFDGRDGLYPSLAGNHGTECFQVGPGTEFCRDGSHRYRINPERRGDYRKLLKDLGVRDEPATCILVNCFPVQGRDGNQPEGGMATQCLIALLLLIQTLMEEKENGTVRVVYTAWFDGGPPLETRVVNAVCAGVAGFGRTLSLEHPRFFCKSVAFAGPADRDDAARFLFREFGATDAFELQYRDGVRMSRQYRKAVIPGATGPARPDSDFGRGFGFKEKGTYIITGGAGGLGLIFARYISQRAGCNLFLLGRSAPAAGQQREISELERLGAHVTYIRTDIAQAHEFRQLIKEIKTRHGKINGIIHCAGLIRDSYILRKTAEQARRVCGPKIDGTLNILESIRGEPVEFLVLFSSLSAVFGNTGQADYAFSNAFMDRMAEQENQIGPPVIKSINWPLWEKGGMEKETGVTNGKEAFFSPLSTQKGLQAFETCMALPHAQCLVLDGSIPEKRYETLFAVHHFRDDAKNRTGEGRGNGSHGGMFHKTLAFLKQVLCDKLKLAPEQVESHVAFSEYGVDSIIIKQVNAVLESQVGVLPQALLLEYPDLHSLAGYFTRHHARQMENIPEPVDNTAVPAAETVEIPGTAPEDRGKADGLCGGIAVIGMAGRYPGAGNLEKFWEMLKGGVDALTEIPRARWDYRNDYDPDPGKGKMYCKWGGFLADTDKFDPLFFNLSPLEAKRMLPEERIMLEIVWSTLEDGGYGDRLNMNRNTGVFMGVTSNTFPLLEMEKSGESRRTVNNALYNIPNRISGFFDFHGPSLVVDTACSSSLAAVHMACQSLKLGECAIAIAGGVNLYFHPSKYRLLCDSRQLSAKRDAYLFEKNSDGFIPGEGAGAVLLKPLEAALEDRDFIYGVIKGSGISHKGRENGSLLPSPQSQAELIRRVIRQAGISPETIGYLELQAAGAGIVNSAELLGIKQAFRDIAGNRKSCALGSVQPYIGHLEAASGMAHLARVLLQMRHGRLLPNRLDDQTDYENEVGNTLFFFNNKLRPWKPVEIEQGDLKIKYPRRAGVTSFGAGGLEAHIIVEEFDNEKRNPGMANLDRSTVELMPLSAETRDQLYIGARSLRDFIRKNLKDTKCLGSVFSLSNIAFSLQMGRMQFTEKCVFLAKTLDELLILLDCFLEKKEESASIIQGKGRLVDENFPDNHDLDSLYTNKDFRQAASLWVQGVNIEWCRLKDHSACYRLPLPTYPFKKEKVWLYDGGLTVQKQISSDELDNTRNFLSQPRVSKNEVSQYYDSLVSEKGKNQIRQQNRIYFIFAPFESKIKNFSWLLTAFEPEKYREYSDLAYEKKYEMKKVLFKQVNLKSVKKVLDIGCGFSSDLITLAQTYSQLKGDGYTISSNQAKIGREYVNEAGLDGRIQIFNRDSSKDSFPDTYDLVTGFEVTFHIKNKEGLFKNIAGHLSEKGQVVLADVIANTVTAVEVPHLGQYTITQQEFSIVLGHNHLKLVECVDVSREISNYLHDPDFERHLESIGSRLQWPDHVKDVHKGWHHFGLALDMALFKYVLLTIERANPDEHTKDLCDHNMEKFMQYTRYKDIVKQELPLSNPELYAKQSADLSKELENNEVSSEISDICAMEQYIKELICRVLEVPAHERRNFNTHARFVDYGINSLIGLKILDMINRELGLRLKIRVLYDCSSAHELSRHIIKMNPEGFKERSKTNSANDDVVAVNSDTCTLLANNDNLLKTADNEAAFYKNEKEIVPDEDGSVAIIGISGRFPGAENTDEFWENLVAGLESVVDCTEYRQYMRDEYNSLFPHDDQKCSLYCGMIKDEDKFDPLFFEITPVEAEMMDPQQRLFLTECYKALEDAGYNRDKLSNVKCGVYAGLLNSNYSSFIDDIKNRKHLGHLMLGNSSSILASRISYYFNLKGPAVSVDTACSSSLVSVHLACRSLQNKEADLMMAGGVTLYLSCIPHVMMSKANMLSSNGKCRPFDDFSDGIVPAEGVGVVVLKLLSNAIRDKDHIYGVIKASGINQDGKTNGITAPSAKSQQELITEIYNKYRINPESITYVECHGTGTKLGDPIELAALTDTFNLFTEKEGFCAIGSVKANIGHTSAASGVIGLIKILLCLKHKLIPPMINYETPNKHIHLAKSPFYINKKLKIWRKEDSNEKLRAAISSFGFSGTNCHMVIEEPPKRKTVTYSSGDFQYIVPLSAKNKTSLKNYILALIDFLAENYKNHLRSSTYDQALFSSYQKELAADIARILGIDQNTISYDDNVENFSIDFKISPQRVYELLQFIHRKYDVDFHVIQSIGRKTIKTLAECILLTNKAGLFEHLSLVNLAYTLQKGRSAMHKRLALVASSMDEVIDKLRLFVQGEVNVNGLFYNDIEHTPPIDGLMFDGKEGQDYIRNVVRKGKLDKICRLWMSGVDIDWDMLYPAPEEKPVLIPLPGYHFQKERYWLGTPGEEPAGQTRETVHPLIDWDTTTPQGQRFFKNFKSDAFYLRDHLVAGRPVLPGVAHLEMARAAAEQASGGNKVRVIKDIVWERPLIVAGSESAGVTIELGPGNAHMKFEIGGAGGQNPDIVYSRGTVVYGEAQHDRSRVNITKVRQRCPRVMERAECYREFEAAELHYGTGFKIIERILYSRTEVLSELRPPARTAGIRDKGFLLHPAIMDGALQSIMPLLGSLGKASLYTSHLPFALEEVSVYGSLDRACYVYAAFSDDAGGNTGLVEKFNIRILDEAGDPLVRFKNLAMKKMSRNKASGLKSDAGMPETFYYRPIWKRSLEEPAALPRESTRVNTPTGRGVHGLVLVFDRDETLRDRLRRLHGPGTVPQVVLVRPCSRYQRLDDNTYAVNPGSAEDYDNLIQDLAGRNFRPERIVCNWADDGGNDLKAPEHLDNSLYFLTYLSQALMRQNPTDDIRLLYFYHTSDESPNPHYAALAGFARTVFLENPRLQYKIVALFNFSRDQSGPHCEKLSGIIEFEFGEEALTDIEIRYDGRGRYVRRYEVCGPPATPPGPDAGVLREGGVYLITGGAGGLGLLISERIAQHVDADLVLAGRSLPGPSQERRINRIRETGSRVSFRQTDISDFREAADLMAWIKSRHGKINGVIHCAGLTRDSLLFKKERKDIEAVIAPKIRGVLYLDELTSREDLDFFSVFSSVSTVAGNAGQADYAYANGFMDHFCVYRDTMEKMERRSGKTVSINWPFWEDGGMRVDQRLVTAAEKNGLLPLDKESGAPAFLDALHAGIPRIIILRGRPDSVERFLTLGHNRYSLPGETPDASGDTGPGGALRQNKKNETGPLAAFMEQYLIQVISGVSKIPGDRIDPVHMLEKYGIDSMMVIELTRTLESDFGALSKTLLFEFLNVRELAGYFLENHRETVIRLAGEQGLPAGDTSPGYDWPERKAPGEPPALAGDILLPAAREDVAIIGVAGCYPGAADLVAFWDNLKNGRNCITTIPRERWDFRRYYEPGARKQGRPYCKWGGFVEDADKFDPLFFNIAPGDAVLIDPQQRLFLETAWHTIENAGYTRTSLSGSAVGVFVGVMYGHYQLLETDAPEDEWPASGSGSYASIANRVSYLFDFHGPSMAVDTMCSSSLTAIHLACESIRRKETGLALAGGVNLSVHPNKYLQLCQGRLLSSEGICKSFGKDGDGYVPGEGAGAVLLKPLSKAEADGDHIYAVIKGSAVNHGGKTNGYTVPNPVRQTDLIKDAFYRAGVDPATVSYVEAHGTGTALGDPIEITGLNNAFKGVVTEKQSIPIGSVKSNIGHLESAAGIAGLTKILLQMKHGKIAPSIHSEALNPHIDFDSSPFYVATQLAAWKKTPPINGSSEPASPLRAGLSSFGAGGSNGHMVVEAYDHHGRDAHEGGSEFLFVLSAKNESRLKAYAGKMAGFLNRDGLGMFGVPLSMTDLAYTLQTGREEMETRLAITARGRRELLEALEDYRRGRRDTGRMHTGDLGVKRAAAIDGQGADISPEQLCRDGALARLAALWVTGVKIPWLLLYPGQKPGRIPLPTYPFERRRFWLPLPGKRTPIPGAAPERTSAFRFRRVPEPDETGTEGARFETELTGDEPYLKDHIIHGARVLPAVVYIEMVMAAGAMLGRGRVAKIRNMVWLRPLEIPENTAGRPVAVAIEITVDKEMYRFEILSFRDGQSQTHTQGRFRLEHPGRNRQATPDTVDAAALERQCGTVLEGAGCYELFRSYGIDYGPSFQAIEELRVGNGRAFSRLRLPKGRPEMDRNFLFHPGLLDGAFQTIAGLSRPGGQTSPRVPFSISEIEFFGSPGSRCVVLVEPSDAGKRNKNGTDLMDVTMAGTGGILLARFKGLAVREISPHGSSFDMQPSLPQPGTTCYETVFTPSKNSRERETELPDKIMVFDADGRFRREFRNKLKGKRGVEPAVILVLPGSEFRRRQDGDGIVYEIDPRDPRTYEAMMKGMAESGSIPGLILYLWPLRPGKTGKGPIAAGTVANHLEYSIYSLLNLTRQLFSGGYKKTVKLQYYYQEQTPRTTALDAAFSGFARTVALENPRFDYRAVALQIGDTGAGFDKDQAAMLADCALTEFRFSGEPHVLVKNGSRYVPRLERIDTATQRDKAPTGASRPLLRHGGVYLITGGAGGLGLIFAEYLSEKFNACLILTGRSKLDAERQAKIRAFKERNTRTSYIRTDISSRADVFSLVQRIRDEYGELNGIIHSAGVLDDAMIRNKSVQSMEKVILPKVRGACLLDEATGTDKLDFFVLFSSIASVFGNVGQADYAFANSFLDHFAVERNRLACPENGRNRERFGKTLSINWPLWRDGGMAIEAQAEAHMKKKYGFVPLETGNGIAAFLYLLAMDISNAAVISGTPKASRENGETEVRPDTADGAGQDLLQRVITDLVEIASDLLGVSGSDLDEESWLEEFGMDSIKMITMLNRIESLYGNPVEPSALEEHRTLKSLAGYLVSEGTAGGLPDADPKTENHELPAGPGEKTGGGDPQRTGTGRPGTGTASGASSSGKIAVIGMACRFPESNGPEAFWRNLEAGKSMIREVPGTRWDIREHFSPDKRDKTKTYSKWGGFINHVDLFDPGFFNIPEEDAVIMDPQHRILLELTQELFDRSGYEKQDVSDTDTAVFIGGGESTYLRYSGEAISRMIAAGDLKHVVVNNSQNMAAARISNFYNLKSVSQIVDTACSSSLVAIHHACRSIRNGESGMAIAGGIDLLLDPAIFIGFSNAEVLSDDGACYVFDEKAKGFVLGEGAGLVLLKEYERAVRDGDQVLGIIRGSAVNNDGYTVGATVPNAQAQKEVIAEAISQSGIAGEDISYLEAHGTGTLLGDPIEVRAASGIYGACSEKQQFCAIGSVKSNVGHLLRAAGIAGFIKVLLMLEYKKLPPTINCMNPHPRFRFGESPFFPNTGLKPWEPPVGKRYAAISSFGFGGTNCHMVIEEFRAAENDSYRLKRPPLQPTLFNRKAYWLGKKQVDPEKGRTGETGSDPAGGTHEYGTLTRKLLSGDLAFEDALVLLENQ